MFFLVVFGALVGWITAILQVPRDHGHRFIAYANCMIAGAVGGGTSGLLFLLMTRASIRDYNAQVNALLVAIFGAIIFAVIVLTLQKRSQ